MTTIPNGRAQLPLDEIQGDILAGFRKNHQAFVFLSFPDRSAGRTWLRALLDEMAITTTRALVESDDGSVGGYIQRPDGEPETPAPVWTNLSFTAVGLRNLAPAMSGDVESFHAFDQGPAARAATLGDVGPSGPGAWRIGRSNQVIHALLNLAGERAADLDAALDRQRGIAERCGVAVLDVQRGATLPGTLRGHEHFGFKDGISQPGIRGFHPADPENPTMRAGRPGTRLIPAGEFLLGYPRSNGFPLPAPEWMRNGSFQVFRRLRQDVARWQEQLQAQVQTLPENGGVTSEWLAAKLIGRWPNGTPLAQVPTLQERKALGSATDDVFENAFDYRDDQLGRKTPRFAHVRKMYPRDDDRFHDDRRRILRRGIPYGELYDPAGIGDAGPDADRGLLFNAYMASIEDQFEFLQRSWANNAGWPAISYDGRRDGHDPVIGVDSGPLTLRLKGARDQHLDFHRFVSTTGAVYAFVPSITTLRRLALGNGGATAA